MRVLFGAVQHGGAAARNEGLSRIDHPIDPCSARCAAPFWWTGTALLDGETILDRAIRTNHTACAQPMSPRARGHCRTHARTSAPVTHAQNAAPHLCRRRHLRVHAPMKRCRIINPRQSSDVNLAHIKHLRCAVGAPAPARGSPSVAATDRHANHVALLAAARGVRRVRAGRCSMMGV